MYEHMKNDFIVAVEPFLSPDILDRVLGALDNAVKDYDIQEKSTELISYGEEIPNLVKTYIVCKKIEGLSETTLYNYMICLKNFFSEVRKQPEQVASNEIRLYLYTYKEKKRVSNRSLDKIRQIINGFFQWAQDEEYIRKNPAKSIAGIKYEAKQRQSLTQIELEYIRKACRTKREKAIIEVLYSTGCRVSELTGIELTDVDFDSKTVHLYGKGKKHRDSFLNAKAEVALKDYILNERKGSSTYLFTGDRKPYGRLHKEAVEKIIRNIAGRTEGINKKVTPHVFRHTTATTALRNGMPVESIQLMLGHSKIDTTMIYAHADKSTVKAQHQSSVI